MNTQAAKFEPRLEIEVIMMEFSRRRELGMAKAGNA
jgi:hypothetical protein